MTGERRVNVSPAAAGAALVIVLLGGVGGTYLIMRRDTPGSPPTMSNPDAGLAGDASMPPSPANASSPSAREGASSQLKEVVVALTPEAVARAGIEIGPVTTVAAADRVRLPGVVEPNAYRQVAVTPLVAGRIVQVASQLGDRVRRGQSLAYVYSPELADARTKYVAAKAMLEAHDRELQRAQKLVEIGAASRQELERIHAEHAAQTAEVESARSRLELLGAAGDSPSPKPDNDATIAVPAPIDGVVTERMANQGQNVDPTTKLFSIVDLSNVWVVADLYERDLHRVREGARATLTTSAYPDLSLEGRVSYIDPQLNTATRTAKVRIEVMNPRGDLRFGMYMDVSIGSGGSSARGLAVPRAAIQTVAGRQVVYVSVPGEPGTFIEREVTLGSTSGEVVEVVSGLKAGDTVASRGSFFIRAEAERLGLRTAPSAAVPSAQPRAAEGQAAKIVVTDKGFEPDRITVRSGVPVRLTVVRTSDKTCGTEIVLPSLKITRALPLNEPVVIEFTPAKAGDIPFACGMNMLKGVVVVQ
jgi:RND family efflux transporter MFP subunit